MTVEEGQGGGVGRRGGEEGHGRTVPTLLQTTKRPLRRGVGVYRAQRSTLLRQTTVEEGAGRRGVGGPFCHCFKPPNDC